MFDPTQPHPKPRQGESRADFIERERAYNRERQEWLSAQRPVKRKGRAKAKRSSDPYANTYMRDPDGYDRDNLGESPDY